jgi:hypothetical protein
LEDVKTALRCRHPDAGGVDAIESSTVPLELVLVRDVGLPFPVSRLPEVVEETDKG